MHLHDLIFQSLITIINNQLAEGESPQVVTEAYVAIINCTLYGDMNYVSIQHRIQPTHVCLLISQIVHVWLNILVTHTFQPFSLVLTQFNSLLLYTCIIRTVQITHNLNGPHM